jgi:hypothetical protein
MLNNLRTRISNILGSVLYKCKISGTITADPGTARQTLLAYERATGELIGSAVWDDITHQYVIYLPSIQDEGIMLTRRDEGGTFASETYDRLSLCNEVIVPGVDWVNVFLNNYSFILTASKSLFTTYPSTIQHENLRKIAGSLYFDKNFKEGVFRVSGSNYSLPRKVRGCVYADNDIIVYDGNSQYFETGNINPALGTDPFGDGSLMACYPMNVDGKDCTGNYPAVEFDSSRFNKGGYNYYYNNVVPFTIPIVITRAATRTIVFSFEHYLSSSAHQELFIIPGLLYVTLHASSIYFYSIAGETWTNALAYTLVAPIFSEVQVAVVVSSSGLDKVFVNGSCRYTKAVGIPTVTNNQYLAFHGNLNGSTAEVVIRDVMIFNREIKTFELRSLWNTTNKKSGIPSISSITASTNTTTSLSLIGSTLTADLKARFPLSNGIIGNTLNSSGYTVSGGVFVYKDYVRFNGTTGFLHRSKILGWFDPDDVSTITIATGVSKWLDKSGNGNNLTQGTTGAQPSRQTNIINGRAIVRFDGTDDQLVTSAKLNAAVVSMFYIQKTTDTQYIVFSDGAYYWGAIASADSVVTSPFSHSICSFYVDGTLSPTDNRAAAYTALNNRNSLVSLIGADFSLMTGFRVGGFASWFPAIDLGEVIILPGIPTKEVQQGVEGFLAHRWGTTAALPESHLYKSSAPTGTLEEIVAGTDRVNLSSSDLSITFTPLSVTAQCIYKKGNDLEGLAVGIDSTAHATLYVRNANVLTSSSFTTVLLSSVKYRFELKGVNITLYDVTGAVIETKAHGLTIGNYSGSESVGAAYGGSPILGTSGNSGFFNGFIYDLTFTDSGTMEEKSVNVENSLPVFYNEEECQVEIVKFDIENNEAVLWVNVPEISATEDTVLIIDAEKVAAKAGVIGTEKAQKVWDNEYIGVYHMVPGTSLIDSTANRFDGELINIDSSNFVSHGTGYALNLNGTDEYAKIKYPVLSDSQRACLTTLFRCDTIADNVRLLDIALSDSQDSDQQLNLQFNASNELTASLYDTSGTLIGDVVSDALTTTTDYNVTVNYDGKVNAGSLEMLVDSVSVDIATPTGERIAATSGLLHLGKDAYAGTYFDGKVSELHISKKQRSADWNKIIDLSMNDELGEYQVVSGAQTGFKVTVPSGTVTSDLTDFPLCITFAPVPSLVYPSVFDTTTVKSTSNWANLQPYHAVNPEKSVLGDENYNAWGAGAAGPQKFNIDYELPKIATRMLLENFHSTSYTTTAGIKNFSIYGTNSVTAFNNTTYEDTADLVLLGTFQARQHIAVNASDPQYFYFDNIIAYRYYILRIVDNWGGGGGYPSLRRVSFLASDEVDVREELFNQCGDPTKLVFKQGNTELSAEIELWDADNKKCIFHVKVPTVSSSADTTIDITVGTDVNPLVGDIGSTAARGVWSNGYSLVCHLNSLTIVDSTGKQGNGTLYNSPVLSSINGDLAIDFTPSAYIQFSALSQSDLSDNGWTAEIIHDSDTQENRQFITAGTVGYNIWIIGAQYRFVASTNGSDWNPMYLSPVSLREQYTAISCNKVNTTSIYTNETLTTTLGTGAYTTPDGIIRLGAHTALQSANMYNGRLRSFRWSNVVRSADWLKLTSLCLQENINTHEVSLADSKVIQIILSKATEALTDFPVTVYLDGSCGLNNYDSSFLFTEIGDYTDLAFFDSNDNPLYAEVALWDTINKRAVIHVKVPLVGSVDNTHIFLDYSGDYKVVFTPSMFVNVPNSTHSVDSTGLVITRTAAGGDGWWSAYAANAIKNAGKKYWEVKLVYNANVNKIVGLTPTVYADAVNNIPGYSGAIGFGWQNQATTLVQNWISNGVNGVTYTQGDVLIFAVDIAAGKLWVGKNGVWALGNPVTGINPTCTFPASTPVFPSITDYIAGDITELRLAAASMQYSPPAGFTAWDNDELSKIGAIGSYAAQQVWDSGYVAVYHMSQDPGVAGACIKDSTSNANHGTPTGMTGANLVTTPYGSGITFNGSSQYILVPDSPSFLVTQMTMEVLVNPAAVTNSGVIQKAYPYGYGEYCLTAYNTGGGWCFRVNSSTTTGSGQIYGSAALQGAWSYVACSIGPSGQSMYVNGYSVSESAWNAAIVDRPEDLLIGGYANTGYLFNGTMSEVRISNIKRSAAWMEYTNRVFNDLINVFILPSAEEGEAPTLEGWNGTFIEVGTGKPYTSLTTAVNEAVTGTLILVHPGTYVYQPMTIPARKLFMRGVGASPSDVYIHTSSSQSAVIYSSAGCDFIIENVRLHSHEFNNRQVFNCATLSKTLINKCYIESSNGCVCFRYFGQVPEVIVKNCYVSSVTNYYHFYECDISNTTLDKVQLQAALSAYSTTGTFISSDYVITSTDGYGYGYGDDILLDIANYCLYGITLPGQEVIADSSATFTIPAATVQTTQKNIPVMLRLSNSSGLTGTDLTGLFTAILANSLYKKISGTNPRYHEFGFTKSGLIDFNPHLLTAEDGPRFEKFGSFRFNGSTSVLDITNNISRALLAGTLTCSMLVYPELLHSVETNLFGVGSEFQITYTATTGRLIVRHTSTGITTAVSLMPNRWNHIIVLRDVIAKTIVVYQDKYLSYSAAYTNSPTISATAIYIGSTTLTGRIADVQIFNRILTSSEINDLFNNSEYSLYKENFVTSLIKQDVPVTFGEAITSIQATDNSVDAIALVLYSVSTDQLTYKVKFNNAWKSIATSDPTVHGYAGDNNPYYWDGDSQEWVYSNSSIEEAISNALQYPANRMDKTTLNAITDFSPVYSPTEGKMHISTSLWSDGTIKPEVTSIKLNNKNYWVSDLYTLSDYCSTVSESSVNYSIVLPDSVANYMAATKLYCWITGGTQWVECVNGTIPNVPVGLETAGKQIRFRVTWDLSVWVNPADISIEVLIK